jgi:branched-chain amino acid transport system ATP-binding protein
MTAVLEVAGLTAGYGGAPVVREVSLRVQAGEVVALLGANGAGKTTTLLSIAGVLAARTGTIRLNGEDVSGRRPERLARDGLILVPDVRGVFHLLSVADNLRLGARRYEAAFELFPELRALRERRAGVLSGGEQQMLALAKAIVSLPRVLLIDELSMGLAPVIVERLLPVIRRVALERGVGVLLVEQHTPMALRVADRAYVMRRGAVMYEGTAEELRAAPELLEASYLGRAPAMTMEGRTR